MPYVTSEAQARALLQVGGWPVGTLVHVVIVDAACRARRLDHTLRAMVARRGGSWSTATPCFESSASATWSTTSSTSPSPASSTTPTTPRSSLTSGGRRRLFVRWRV
uniref:Uncharacterized protein n=1 Tax=Oryza glaberrima TaxID=4538 RepID=I1PZV1_ORYGL